MPPKKRPKVAASSIQSDVKKACVEASSSEGYRHPFDYAIVCPDGIVPFHKFTLTNNCYFRGFDNAHSRTQVLTGASAAVDEREIEYRKVDEFKKEWAVVKAWMSPGSAKINWDNAEVYLKMSHKYDIRKLKTAVIAFIIEAGFSSQPNKPNYILRWIPICYKHEAQEAYHACMNFIHDELSVLPWALWPPASDTKALDQLDKKTLVKIMGLSASLPSTTKPRSWQLWQCSTCSRWSQAGALLRPVQAWNWMQQVVTKGCPHCGAATWGRLAPEGEGHLLQQQSSSEEEGSQEEAGSGGEQQQVQQQGEPAAPLSPQPGSSHNSHNPSVDS